MTSRPAIREANRDDLGDLLRLYRSLHASDEPVTLEHAQSTLDRIVADQGVMLFVAESGGRFVASCVLNVCPNLTRGCRPYAVIENVVTDESLRRCGFGKQIVQHALDQAWSRGCYKVMLLTGRSDPGVHQFYESCGFRSDLKRGYVAKPT